MKKHILYIILITLGVIIIGYVGLLVAGHFTPKTFKDDAPYIFTNQNTNSNTNSLTNNNANVNTASNSNVNAPENVEEQTLNQIFPISNTRISDSEKYHYTDVLKNPYNGYTYMIRQQANETFCGPNGSATCDLVEQRGTSKYVIADFFFPDPVTARDHLRGASLAKFQDRNTLVIEGGSADHGGSSQSALTYNISTGRLVEKISAYNSQSSSCSEYGDDEYGITLNSKTLIFSVCEAATKLANGVYVQAGGKTSLVPTNFTQPYRVAFSAIENYQSTGTITLNVNGTSVKFNFEKSKFE